MKTEVFSIVNAFDDDDFDVPNLLRIPFVPENSTGISSKKAKCIPDRYKNIAQTVAYHEQRITADTIMSLNPSTRKAFYYGAPDIATRQLMSEQEATFFAATHRDNEYSVVANPEVDNDLMMETYGKINLSLFFLNHLSMTIEFLDYLGDQFGDQRMTEG